MVKKYRRKPVILEAIQWDGRNTDEVLRFGQGKITCSGNNLIIQTLEGTLTASVGDYIIKGIKGEFYPCKPNIFTQIYEPID